MSESKSSWLNCYPPWTLLHSLMLVWKMDSTTTPRAKIVTFLRAVGAFLFKHHLPLGLIFAVTLGGLWPTPGVALSKLPTSYVCVIIIFLISGLKLKTDDIKTALKSWKSSLYGIFSILFLTSIVSLELIKLLGSQFNDLDVQLDDDNSTSNATSTMSCQTSNLSNASDNSRPLGPREFSTGLQVFFAMPCTVSSGVIMVRQCLAMCVGKSSFGWNLKKKMLYIFSSVILTRVLLGLFGDSVRRQKLKNWLEQYHSATRRHSLFLFFFEYFIYIHTTTPRSFSLHFKHKF